VDAVELVRHVPLFDGLTAEETAALVSSGERITARPGEQLIDEGTAGDTLLIILTGEVEVTKRDGDRQIVLATRKPGEFIGEMSLLEQSPRGASVRAVRDSELLAIGPEAFHKLLEGRPHVATTVLRTVAARLRSTEASLVQNEKLASLGTLAAGLAHELNNPAAAIQRSAGYLREAFETWRRRTVELHALQLTTDERAHLSELEADVINCGPARSDAAARKEEIRLAKRLEALGVVDAWEMAPPLAAYGWSVDRLESLAGSFDGARFAPVLGWLGAGLAAQQLLEEIQRSSKAISDIVGAVKSYAYLDTAKVQDVDIVRAIEDTLMILHHKLKHGIEVVRDFASDMPRVEAYAGELNQVLTNIIDNAIHAMGESGTLSVAARRVGDEVEVTIADTGPGIPEDVQAKIFDPFFTTKPQGVGTGLGLHIARNIVVNRHRGRIDLETRPGHTEFRIRLPLRLASDGSHEDSANA
jgi:signal transduction histidine kinase